LIIFPITPPKREVGSSDSICHFPIIGENMETILVVDDDSSIRSLYSMELSDEGYKVITTDDGQEALNIIENMHVDLVVLDIKMPKMDGLTALKRILELNKNMPIILSTAYSSYKDDNYVAWGAKAFIVKSHDLTELKQAINEYL
jgi:two-component system, response regulator, stage 0 sporulation protein F